MVWTPIGTKGQCGNLLSPIYPTVVFDFSKYDYRLNLWSNNGGGSLQMRALNENNYTYKDFGYISPGVYPISNDGLIPGNSLVTFEGNTFSGATEFYWQLEQQPKNTAPTTPGVFTQLTGNLEIGDSRVLTWGGSTDAQTTTLTYVLEQSIDGATWTGLKRVTTPSTSVSTEITIPTAKTLKFRVKAVDSEGLESAWRESAVFTVTKPKYYWSKYNIDKVKTYFLKEYIASQTAYLTRIYVNARYTFYPSYTFDEITGEIKGSGNPRDGYPRENVGWYIIIGKIYAFKASSSEFTYIVNDDPPQQCQEGIIYQSTTTGQTKDVRGSLIQSGIIAEEGTYPTDGQQGGYWWVRGSRVNQSIAPPGPITTTKQGTILKPDELVTFTFNPSTSPNIKRYDWEMQYNENGFSVQTNDISTTRNYRTTTNKSFTKVQFRVRAQDTNNVYSDYIYSEVYTIQHNVIPTILLNTANNFTMSETEGQNEVLVDGSARDTDANDNIIIKMQINDGTIRNIQSGLSDGSTPIEFSKKITYSNKRVYDGATPISNDLAENVDHTLKVWADDGQGGISTVEERIFRVIHNRPPVISGTDEDLGELLEIPSITYQVDDPEKQTATITERINGQVIRTFDAELGTEYKIEIPIEMWIPLQLEQEHKLTIEAKDSFGAKSTRTYTFTRTEDTIQLELKNPFVTDIAATRILVTPDVYLPIGSTIVIEACNNAFDEVPTWEDVTGMAMNKRGFHFTNTEKTAEQWGINIRFTLHKGTAHDQVKFNGFGGAFD